MSMLVNNNEMTDVIKEDNEHYYQKNDKSIASV